MTPQSSSLAVIPSSTRTTSSYLSASSTARASSAGPVTRETPMEDPMLAGLTNRGQGSPPAAVSGSSLTACHCRRVNQTPGTTGMPSAAKARLMATLSMPTAEAATPEPTYGTSRASR